MRGAPTFGRSTFRSLGLLLVSAVSLWLSTGIAEAQPRTPDPTPGMAPRLPTAPVIGDVIPGLPGTPPGGQNATGEHEPDLLVAVFRPGTPDETPNALAESLNLRIERSYELSGLG